MRFPKISCPTDFSPGSERALRVAAWLANEAEAELVVVHAWHIPPSAFAGEPSFPPHTIEDIVADAQRALDDSVRQAAMRGARQVSGRMLSGTPWVEIVDQLEKEAFDLCVIGTHGRTGLARIFLGSVTEKVVRHAPCSVLVVRPDTEVERFSHVLVPTDFSEGSRVALERAAQLVDPAGTITLLHVIEVPVAHSGEILITDFARNLDKRAMAALEEEAARLAGETTAAVRIRSRIGYPGAQTIVAVDADPSIDLVVMGSHGRTGFARVLLGSVAEKVVRHARCPVLVARRRA